MILWLHRILVSFATGRTSKIRNISYQSATLESVLGTRKVIFFPSLSQEKPSRMANFTNLCGLLTQTHRTCTTTLNGTIARTTEYISTRVLRCSTKLILLFSGDTVCINDMSTYT